MRLGTDYQLPIAAQTPPKSGVQIVIVILVILISTSVNFIFRANPAANFWVVGDV